MKCIVCNGDRVIRREVDEEIFSGNDIVCLKVAALVCETCGERYYDRATMRLMEESEKKIQHGELRLREVGKVLAVA